MITQKLLDSLYCSKCKDTSLKNNSEALICSNCKSVYKIENNAVIHRKLTQSNIVDPLDSFKNKLKKFEALYKFLIFVIAPVLYTESWELKRFLKTVKQNKTLTSSELIIDLGSGNRNINKEIINVDYFNYDTVSICSDISDTPFKNNSVKAIINTRVLEHVPSPEHVVKEMYRILDTGGYVFCTFPFIQGFHASPYDFSRRTHKGMELLFNQFEIIKLYPQGGPTSGLLWILQEWLAQFLSFGFKPLYWTLYIILMGISWPLKIFDIVLKYHPMAKHISSEFTIICKKK